MTHALARVDVAHAHVVAKSVGRRRIGQNVDDERGDILGGNVAARLKSDR